MCDSGTFLMFNIIFWKILMTWHWLFGQQKRWSHVGMGWVKMCKMIDDPSQIFRATKRMSNPISSWVAVCARWSINFGYFPSCTVSIVLYFHKHKSLPLGRYKPSSPVSDLRLIFHTCIRVFMALQRYVKFNRTQHSRAPSRCKLLKFSVLL